MIWAKFIILCLLSFIESSFLFYFMLCCGHLFMNTEYKKQANKICNRKLYQNWSNFILGALASEEIIPKKPSSIRFYHSFTKYLDEVLCYLYVPGSDFQVVGKKLTGRYCKQASSAFHQLYESQINVMCLHMERAWILNCWI